MIYPFPDTVCKISSSINELDGPAVAPPDNIYYYCYYYIHTRLVRGLMFAGAVVFNGSEAACLRPKRLYDCYEGQNGA